MEVSDAKFWLAVLRVIKGKCQRWYPPSFSKNKEILGAETFLEQTDESVLPELSVSTAMELLKLEKHFVPTSPSASDLSILQERGLEALTCCSDADPLVIVEL